MESQLPNNPFKLAIYFMAPQKWRTLVYCNSCCLVGTVPSIDSIFFKHIIDSVEVIEDAFITFGRL